MAYKSGVCGMNNEPVAWMNIHGQFNKKETWLFPIPLYNHPAKELTVDEVMSEHCTCYKLGYNPLNDYRKVKAK